MTARMRPCLKYVQRGRKDADCRVRWVTQPRRLIAATLVLAAIMAAGCVAASAGVRVNPAAAKTAVRAAIPAPGAERALRHAERLARGAPGARGDMTLALMAVVQT